MGDLEVSGDREFSYPVLGLRLGFLALAGVTSGLFLGGYLPGVFYWHVIASGATAQSPVQYAWAFHAAAAVCALFLVGCAYGLIHLFRLNRHAGVLITRVGITVTDWRGRERSLFWHQVEEARTGRRRRVGPMACRSTLTLYGDGREVFIEYGITDRAELRDEIVRRAGLVPAKKTWYGVVTYRRPPSPSF